MPPSVTPSFREPEIICTQPRIRWFQKQATGQHEDSLQVSGGQKYFMSQRSSKRLHLTEKESFLATKASDRISQATNWVGDSQAHLQDFMQTHTHRWLLRRAQPLTPTPSSTMVLVVRLRFKIKFTLTCKYIQVHVDYWGEENKRAGVITILSLDKNINSCVSFSSLTFLSKVELV